MSTLPDDILKMIEETEPYLTALESKTVDKEEARFLFLKRIAAKYQIKVERIPLPICNCAEPGHTVVKVDLESTEEALSEWLHDKASPIRVYKTYANGDGKTYRYRICSLIRVASPLVLLARQEMNDSAS